MEVLFPEIEIENRRLADRAALNAAGRLLSPFDAGQDSAGAIEIQVLDTSRRGIGFAARTKLPVNSFWQIRYDLRRERVCHVPVTIRWKQALPNGLYLYGGQADPRLSETAG